jgi:dolichol-phosphate mannosyltransferase
MKENIVIIPTYKEKENIENIIRYVFGLPKDFNILIIDDNSPDGIADIVKNLMLKFPGQLFYSKGKANLVLVLLLKVQRSLENGYRYIYEMDADFP